jgi:hypothetical protein
LRDAAGAEFGAAWAGIPASDGTQTPAARDAHAVFADLCMFERILERHGVSLNQTLIDAAPWPELTPALWPWNSTFPAAACRPLPSDWPAELHLSSIAALGGGVLRATPDQLERLVRLVEAGATRLPLSAVVTIGPPPASGLIAHLRGAFAAPAIAIWYEPGLGIIAHDLPGQDSWTPCAGTQRVEILDAQGNPAGAGERGRVAVTSFYDIENPIIRRKTGYSAIAAAGPGGHPGLAQIARI